jgi:ABC-type branched-subunit amino acid transport system substrate-binding protein
LTARIKTKSGIDADAFTLAAYDALQVAVAAYRAVGSSASIVDLKSAFVQAAGTYTGATGPTLLNAAGDRDGGAFDFWSLKASTNTFIWYRSSSFEPVAGGAGTITRYP